MQFSIVLTDPLIGDNDLVMKPFQKANKIRVIYSPITYTVASTNVQLFNKFVFDQLQPKMVFCSQHTADQISSLRPNQALSLVQPTLCPLTSTTIIQEASSDLFSIGTPSHHSCKISNLNNLQMTTVGQGSYKISQV